MQFIVIKFISDIILDITYRGINSMKK